MNKIQDIKKFDKGNTKLTYKKIESKRDCQSQVVVVQLRSSSDKVGMDSDLHRRLERHFPDCEERMSYQKKQAEFYKSTLRKNKK